MPLYEYRCPRCGVTTEQQRKIAERDDVIKCPECNTKMEHIMSAPAPMFPGSGSWRG